jgi:DNA-binding CsgD family transcriptional regulator
LPQAPLGVRIPSTIVFVQDPQDVADGVDVLFQHRYGLTQAELAVVAALLRGETLREFAERSSRSLNTLRVLVKRAFAKTGARTQAQLVRIAMEDIVFRSFINI